jgi:hypothetical protein
MLRILEIRLEKIQIHRLIDFPHYPANLQPVLPQFELLGHVWTLSLLLFI